MKNKPTFFSFETGRRPMALSAQNWQKPVRPEYTYLPSREICPEVVFVEELRPKSRNSNTEMKPRDSTMWQTWEVRCCKMAASALD